MYTSKLFTAAEVAEILGISKSGAYNLMRTQFLPTVRFGRSARVRPEDLEKFISCNIFINDQAINVMGRDGGKNE
jgi:excisionase family DNA binding protein